MQLHITYNNTEILTIDQIMPGQQGITYAPAGINVLSCPALQAAEMLTDQGLDIKPLYDGGFISKPGHEPYVKVNISALPADPSVQRFCIVRRIPIRFDMINFKVVCEVQHFKDGQHLGEENTDLDPADVINDKWHVFTTTNNIMIPTPEGDVGEFDYYFKVLKTIPFQELTKSSILQLDQLGRFDD